MLNFRGPNKRKIGVYTIFFVIILSISCISFFIYSFLTYNKGESAARYYNNILHTSNGLRKEQFIEQSEQSNALIGASHETSVFMINVSTQESLFEGQPFKDCENPQENLDCSEAGWRQVDEASFMATYTKYVDKNRTERDAIFVIHFDKKEKRLILRHTQY